MASEKKRFLIIEEWMMEEKMGIGAMLLAHLIFRTKRGKRPISISIPGLADDLGLSEQQIKTARNHLLEGGWIEMEGEQTRRRRYRITEQTLQTRAESTETTQESTEFTTQESTESTQESTESTEATTQESTESTQESTDDSVTTTPDSTETQLLATGSKEEGTKEAPKNAHHHPKEGGAGHDGSTRAADIDFFSSARDHSIGDSVLAADERTVELERQLDRTQRIPVIGHPTFNGLRMAETLRSSMKGRDHLTPAERESYRQVIKTRGWTEDDIPPAILAESLDGEAEDKDWSSGRYEDQRTDLDRLVALGVGSHSSPRYGFIDFRKEPEEVWRPRALAHEQEYLRRRDEEADQGGNT